MEKEQLTYNDTLVRKGGLMRCCLQSLGEWVEHNKDQPIEDGKILDCRFEKPLNKKMVLEGRTWRWNDDQAYRD